MPRRRSLETQQFTVRFASTSLWIWGIQLSRNCSTWMLRPMWLQTFRRHRKINTKQGNVTWHTWRPRPQGLDVPGESGHPSEGHSASAHGVRTRIERIENQKKTKKSTDSRDIHGAVLYLSILKKTKMEIWTKTKTRSERKVTEMRYYANWCQLVLAVVEIVVTKIKAKSLADGEKKTSPTDWLFNPGWPSHGKGFKAWRVKRSAAKEDHGNLPRNLTFNQHG